MVPVDDDDELFLSDDDREELAWGWTQRGREGCKQELEEPHSHATPRFVVPARGGEGRVEGGGERQDEDLLFSDGEEGAGLAGSSPSEGQAWERRGQQPAAVDDNWEMPNLEHGSQGGPRLAFGGNSSCPPATPSRSSAAELDLASYRTPRTQQSLPPLPTLSHATTSLPTFRQALSTPISLPSYGHATQQPRAPDYPPSLTSALLDRTNSIPSRHDDLFDLLLSPPPAKSCLTTSKHDGEGAGVGDESHPMDVASVQRRNPKKEGKKRILVKDIRRVKDKTSFQEDQEADSESEVVNSGLALLVGATQSSSARTATNSVHSSRFQQARPRRSCALSAGAS
jgi:hypothetical protein